MGAKKQWNGKEKLAIVLQGLKGERNISELCNELCNDVITQGVYYKWRVMPPLKNGEHYTLHPSAALMISTLITESHFSLFFNIYFGQLCLQCNQSNVN